MFSSVSASISGKYLGSTFPADSGVVFDLDALVGVFDVDGLVGVFVGGLIGVMSFLLDDAVVVVGTLLEEDVVAVKTLLLEEDAIVAMDWAPEEDAVIVDLAAVEAAAAAAIFAATIAWILAFSDDLVDLVLLPMVSICIGTRSLGQRIWIQNRRGRLGFICV
jgi:hypothetical protein